MCVFLWGTRNLVACFSPSYLPYDKKKYGGYAMLTMMIVVLGAGFVVSTGFAFFVLQETHASRAFTKSIMARHVADAGIEDIIYRIVSDKQTSSPETLNVGSDNTTVTTTLTGAKYLILSEGRSDSTTQRKQAELERTTTGVSFFYGVQVGDLGVTMGNNSVINGNVYSNGDIIGGGVNKTTITGTAVAAGNHLIKDIDINNDAYADRFDNCSVIGAAHYVTSFSANCTAGFVIQDVTTQPPGVFPIPPNQITSWKTEAEAGGVLTGLNLGSNTTVTLGPKKINGDIDIENGGTLILTGTIWITGTINFGNNATIRLDPATYDDFSGVLVADGPLAFGNTATLQGSGVAGSYLLAISMFGPGDAINMGNSANSTIFYAPNGIIAIGNGLSLREATARGMRTGNNTTLTYDTGLANMLFTSGPSGGYMLNYWKEN
ncbi:MAG: Uncharacterized protein G01um101466_31 [Parcubacteria group bacterium Gr01-1014_66]|nr:MAG: Uncharacterized protein G01um101466_31 [Parcubacteria group bacterium Gr01-1014_66]